MKNILFVLLFTVTCGLSQELDVEKVSSKDFEIQSTDTTRVHDAVLIFNNISVNFVSGFQYISVHQRIRIETIEGLDYANQQIDLFKSGREEEELVALSAATYHLEGDKITTSYLEENVMLTEKKDDNYVSKFFMLPDVKVGSVLEVIYVIKSSFIAVEDIALQQEIPTINLNVLLEFPAYQVYYLETNPLAPFKIDLNKKFTKEGMDTLQINKKDSKYLDQDTVLKRLHLRHTTVVFSEKNIPALLEEPFSGEWNKYQAKLIISLADGYDSGYQQKIRSFNSNWSEVANNLFSNDYFGEELKSSRFFRKELEVALEGVTGDKNKILKILSFLKSKVKWNDQYGVFTDQGVRRAFRDGKGNTAELNLLLTTMLNEYGIEAYPIIVSATDSDTPLFPTIDGFNYVIVQARTNDATFLLDATEEYFDLNRIPQRALNKKGLRIGKRGKFDWVDLDAKEVQKETTLLTLSLEDDFVATGEGNKKLEDYSLLNPEMIQVNSSVTAIKEFLQNEVFGVEVKNVQVDGLKDLSPEIIFKYDIDYINAFDKIEDRIHIQPLLIESNSINLVELENRTTPLELSQPTERTIIVNIEVPDGYSPVYLPENVKLVYDQGLGSYSYITTFNNNIISTIATYRMNTSVILPQHYETFRKFYKAILEKDGEKVVLEKE